MATNISKILIQASPSRVWDTLTKPELVKLWQYGSDLLTSWQVGTDIKFYTEWENTIFRQWGKVLEVRNNELIKYSLFAPRPELEDKPENYLVMTYELSEEKGLTKLVIVQEDNRPNAAQEEEQGEENPVLQMLKKVAEEE